MSFVPSDTTKPETPRPVRVGILLTGAKLTNGDRNVEYGSPAINMAAAGGLKKVFRKHLRREISDGELEALDMVFTKLGRLATGSAPKFDTYVDAATYMAIAGEIALETVDIKPGMSGTIASVILTDNA